MVSISFAILKSLEAFSQCGPQQWSEWNQDRRLVSILKRMQNPTGTTSRSS